MSRFNLKHFLLIGMTAMLLVLSGCDEPGDPRTMEEKQQAPRPDFKSRLYMSCPQCSAPQRPYRITETKSYYQCTGLPPKFKYHERVEWQHTIQLKEPKRIEL